MLSSRSEIPEVQLVNSIYDGRSEDVEPGHSCACRRLRGVDSARLPSPHLPDEDIQVYVQVAIPLYRAILNGDREEMQWILSRNETKILYSSLTMEHEAALHVAVAARQADIVRELVQRMEPEDLAELRDRTGNTAYCVAVGVGSVKIAKILIQRRSEVALIRGAMNKTPLYIAAVAGYPEMVRFVYRTFEQHINHLGDDELRDIFFACIHASLFDLAIEILAVFKRLAWALNDTQETALGILARKPSAFAGKSSSTLMEYLSCGSSTISMQERALELTKILCKTMSLDEQKSFRDIVDHVSALMLEAAKLGNDKFLAVLIEWYPDLIFIKDEHCRSIFHIAVLHRHAHIFKLFHNLGFQKDVIVRYVVNCPDEENNPIFYNMLHLAAKLPSLDRLSTVSGAALQMQRELLWLKEVENLTPPSEREKRDSKDKLTPRELFTKEHEKLRKAGEEWMKKTAESCMIVATLVTAVVLTVTSSSAGALDESTGIPLFINKTTFQVFTVAGTVALCSSITSTLLFLSIFTSRYSEDDFLRLLPLRLAAGITTLLLSTLALMVDYAAIVFLTYDGKHGGVRWVPLLALAMSVVPVVTIYMLQYHDIISDLWVSAIGY